MLVRLTYISYANTEMSEADIRQILETSKVNNKSRMLTGVLMYSDRYFFQCLEGERREVNRTFLRIAVDPRHSKCMLLDFRDITHRLFPNWSMDYVAFNGANNTLMLRYSENGLFQPYDFNATQADAFLHQVAEAANIQQRPQEKAGGLLSWLRA